MPIYQLLFHSAHPHHSDRCEAIQRHSILIEMRQGQRARQKYDEVMHVDTWAKIDTQLTATMQLSCILWYQYLKP